MVHRAHSSATPAQVWSVLADPDRWSQFDPTVRRVRGAGGRVSTGQHLLAVSRWWSLRIPVDVVEAVPEQRLVLLVHAAPGVRERITGELTSAVRGGTDVRITVQVDGMFAAAALAPLWLVRGLTARLLAASADRLARREREGGQGAA